MAYQRRAPSPSHSRHQRIHDPHRASTGSLQQHPQENMYYSGPPMPPAPPAPGHPHRGPYSNPHSPQGSSEDLSTNFGYSHSVPATPGYPSSMYMTMGHPMAGMMASATAPAPPNMASAPGPPPPQGIRGGDGHAHNRMGSLGRRNTKNEKQHRPNVIHQQHHSQPAPHEYNHERSEFEYRQTPRHGAPVNRRSRSSSRSRDLSPPDSAGPYVLPGQSAAGRPQSAYHSSSSNFSAESYNMDFPNERQQSYIVPNSSHAPGNSREYHLSGPLPGEREFRREGTVYHPNGSRPVLTENQRQRPPGRERSRSRGPHHGSGPPDSRSGDGSDEPFEELYRPGARRTAGTANANEKSALVRTRSRSAPASESRAMIPQQRARPSSETSESSSGSEAAAEQGAGQSQIRIEYGGQTIDINYSGRGRKPPIGNITINTTSRSHTLPLNSSINQRAIAGAPQATPPPTTAAIMPPPAEAPAPPAREVALVPPAPPPLPPMMIPAPPQPSPFVIPPGIEPVVLPPPPQPGTALPAPGGIAPPRRKAGSDGGMYTDDSDRDPRDSLYRDMESLALEGPSSPPFYREGRGRDRDVMPAATVPRPLSRRRRSVSRNRKPIVTKVNREIIARRALEVFGYDFQEQADTILIYQELSKAEFDELITMSKRIRSGEVRVIRHERSPTREEKEHHHRRRRPSQHRHNHNKGRPVSVHGYPGPGPGPSASRPPPGKPALVSNPPPVPPAPEPPQVEAPAPPRQAPPKRPQENPDQPGTYIGYTRNPPRNMQSSASYLSRHGSGKR